MTSVLAIALHLYFSILGVDFTTCEVIPVDDSLGAVTIAMECERLWR